MGAFGDLPAQAVSRWVDLGRSGFVEPDRAKQQAGYDEGVSVDDRANGAPTIRTRAPTSSGRDVCATAPLCSRRVFGHRQEPEDMAMAIGAALLLRRIAA